MPTIKQEKNDQLDDSTSDMHSSRVLEDTPSQPEDEKQIKRIAALDFGRGLAIFGMVLFHVFMRMYDYSYLENMTEGIPEGTSVALLVLFGVLAFFGTWHAFFLFMSSAINTYVTIRKAYKGANMLNNALRHIFIGALLIFIGWIDTSFSYNGYFGQNILGNIEWTNFEHLYVGLFQAETLHMIGFCLILNGIILYFLTRNNGQEKFRRNILIYTGIVLFVLVITAILSYAGPVDGSKSILEYVLSFYTGPDETGGLTVPLIQNAINEFGAFPAWIFSFTLAGLQPFFPFLVTSFAGVMIGILIAKPDVKKKDTKWAVLAGFGLFIIGILLTIVNIKLGYRWTIMQRTASLSTFLIRLGAQIMISIAVLRVVEFRGRGAIFANRPFIKFLRFWSTISLTIYMLQLFEFVPRAILTLIFNKNWIANLNATPTEYGLNFMNEHIIPQGSEVMLVAVALFSMLCFYWLQKLWAKIYYIGSFEWLILKLQQLIFKKPKTRIDSDVLMNKVHWIALGDAKPKPARKSWFAK